LVEAESLGEGPALVLASEDWHPGIIGIVAGRLADLYARPTLLIALGKSRAPGDTEVTVGLGSGRSAGGVELHEALRHCTELLLSHGGHAAAAGFRIDPARVDEFRERFLACVAERRPGTPPAPELVLDAEVPLHALTHGLLQDLDRLEPYGCANRRPLFLASGLHVVAEPTRMGGGERHLGFRVRQEGTTMRAVAFGMGDRLEELMSDGGRCCLAFTPRVNEWNGFRKIELEVADLRPGSGISGD
jgi:single-stranded-DNA-specific exonuclease